MIRSAHLSHRSTNGTRASAKERIIEDWIRVEVVCSGSSHEFRHSKCHSLFDCYAPHFCECVAVAAAFLQIGP